MRRIAHWSLSGMAPALIGAALVGAAMSPAAAQEYSQAPMLEEAVEAGELPALAERLPTSPAVYDPPEVGQHGGQIDWIAGRARDIRIMTVYGYSRLIGYDEELNLVPDILESYEVEDGRIFTFHLREGVHWSDGEPFTTEDFAYEWFDVNQSEDLRPYGIDFRLLVAGEAPEVTIIDDYTVRYAWSQPNPRFLPAIAGARPLYLYAPAHYMRQFHEDHADPEALAERVEEAGARDWVALHYRRGNLYEMSNIELPTLQPWINTTPPPSERFTFVRNPYYHRVDSAGNQLPYLDRVIVNIADSGLIAAQTGTGGSDLQARHIRLDDYAFLSEGAEDNDYTIRLWDTVLGSQIALYPNLNVADPVWREVLRDQRFRQALSLGINRAELNEILFFGLGRPSANTVVPDSPFWSEQLANAYVDFDLERANALLDEMGLTEYEDGMRLLPDGRPAELIIETAGERSVEVDALQLIADSWADIGIGMFVNSSQRDVFRNRVFAGEVTMSVWFGYDNALILPDTVPDSLAPVDQNWLQYPAWGQHWQSAGGAGTAPDLPWGEELLALYEEWLITPDEDRRREITARMLEIHAEQVTSIGTVQGVPQPIVVANRLHNVPEEGVYGWDPGAHFGRYRMDAFWSDQ